MIVNTIEKVSILHLVTAAKNASPFDVNMAYDAGFDKIIPYTNVTLQEVDGLTQDAIFSRSPSGIKREAIFIGGRDIELAVDMQSAAKTSMFAPFEISTFADPSGAFTTAAAMMAKVEHQLITNYGAGFAGRKVSVFGASGPVGGCAAIIAALAGAIVELVSHLHFSEMQARTEAYNARYHITATAVDGASEEAKEEIVANTEVVICSAAAGVRVLNLSQFSQCTSVKVMADVNAVAPSGIEGLDAFANGDLIKGSKIAGIGALEIGQLKYKTQQDLLKKMLASDQAMHLDFNAAFLMAREIVSSA